MINYFKKFFIKQYAKTIPGNKLILITGSQDIRETVKASCIVLAEKLNVLGDAENVEDAILKFNHKYEKIILGINNNENMDRIKKYNLIHPSVGILTEVDPLNDWPYVLLSQSLSKDVLLLVNWEDKASRVLAEKMKSKTYFYGFDPENCHVWAGNLRITDFHTIFELNYGVERVEVNSKLLGFHQINCMLAGAALATTLGFSLTTVKKGLEKIEQFSHRLEVLQGHNSSFIIDDTFNATPQSVSRALDTLNRLNARRRILVLGEIRNLGVESERLHRQIASLIYSNKVDIVFLGGGEANFVADELTMLGFLEDRMEKNLQNPQIVSKLLKTVLKGDVVLITGANGLKFDEVVKKVSKNS